MMAHARHHDLGKRNVAVRQRRGHAHAAQQRLFLDEVRNERGGRHALDAHLLEDAEVLRAVHARDAARHVEHALRYLARHEVVVVLAGGGHEHVGAPDARVLLVLRVAAVAVDDQVAPLKRHRQAVGRGQILLDDGHVVAA